MTIRKLSLFVRWAVALAGTGMAITTPVAAQSISPAEAPAGWVAYAQHATASVTQWLQAPSESAERLRAYIDAARPAPDQATTPLLLKIWIDDDGAVSRVEFSPFVDNEPNADLRGLIVGQRFSEPPPKDMLLPLRIAVQLDAPASRPAT